MKNWWAKACEAKTREEADEAFAGGVNLLMVDGGMGREGATKLARDNIGYFCGYYGRDTQQRVQRWYLS